jgi:hypothetical protein
MAPAGVHHHPWEWQVTSNEASGFVQEAASQHRLVKEEGEDLSTSPRVLYVDVELEDIPGPWILHKRHMYKTLKSGQ